jgi:predicted RNase H-like HicB family nuclease
MSTSARSKSSSKAVDRPFDPAVLRRAREIAAEYQIILQFEEGLYYGRGLEMPTVMNHGKTPDACVRATRDALTTAVAYMLESGQTPPSPASENKRTEQINVRLTPEEKLLLEETARSKGFRGISDFVRSASLASAR